MNLIYRYEGKSSEGKSIRGKMEADSSREVAVYLRNIGYYPVSIEKLPRRTISFRRKIKVKELMIFSQQFSTLIGAGIPLRGVLKIISEQTKNKEIKTVLGEVQRKVESGSSVSEAMMDYPRVFSDFFCQLIKAGETGGILDIVTKKIAEHYENEDGLWNEIKASLYYPALIFLISLLVVIFLMVNILPQFKLIFSGLNAQLPLYTRILLDSGTYIQSYWYLAFIVIFILCNIFIYIYRRPGAKYKFYHILLWLPLPGKLLRKIIISRFASTMEILLDSGVDLLTALAVTEEVVSNPIFTQKLSDCRLEIKGGGSISTSLARSGEFPEMVLQMIRVGEESGKLSEMFHKISEIFNKELKEMSKGLISLIEPMMVIILALLTGFIAISIMLPIFEIFTYF